MFAKSMLAGPLDYVLSNDYDPALQPGLAYRTYPPHPYATDDMIVMDAGEECIPPAPHVVVTKSLEDLGLAVQALHDLCDLPVNYPQVNDQLRHEKRHMEVAVNHASFERGRYGMVLFRDADMNVGYKALLAAPDSPSRPVTRMEQAAISFAPADPSPGDKFFVNCLYGRDDVTVDEVALRIQGYNKLHGAALPLPSSAHVY
jgi:hypothetical protein